MLSSFRFASKQGPCDGFLRLEQSAPVVVKIYPPIYPLWGIAFALVFGYTDSLEVLLIGVPADQQQYLNIRGAYCKESIVVVIWFFRHYIQAWGC
jgi:hypothetical protein